MCILLLTYVKPLEMIDRYLEEHRAFLQKYMADGRFIVAGRRVPRTGGIILANGFTAETIREVIAEDPFHREGLAEYEIIPFQPTMYHPDFERFLKR